MLPTFRWTTIDVNGLPPPSWQRDAIEAAAVAEVRDRRGHELLHPLISRLDAAS
jgi:hypothetical protein